MRQDQGDKLTAVYLWGVKDGRWPDNVVLRQPSDVGMSRPPSRQVGYVRADEAKAESDRLEKTIIVLVNYIEQDGELLCDTVPHFAEMLEGMGLYEMKNRGGRMSAYDDAVAYLDAEVHPRCDYGIYSDMRDIVDEMEAENDKLRELVNDMWICIAHGSEGWDCTGCRRDPDNVCIMGISEFSYRMRELGIEAE